MTLMQWIGLVVGSLIVLARLPGIVWPEEYKSKIRGLLEGRPELFRALGAFLWIVAVATFILVAKTLTLFQALMMILAALFVLGGGLMLFFPDAYRAFGIRALGAMPGAAVRLACVAGVLFGIWIVYLSLTMP